VTTPSQTVGPFFSFGLAERPEVFAGGDVRLEGRVFDGNGDPVPDALVELWQADRDGNYGDGADGFGRCATDGDGRYAFTTVKPGAVSPHAPHVAVSLFARGLLKRLVTRIYFPDEPDANAADPALARADRPETLIATRDGDALRFDIHLQGDQETVFFDI
jgi:protocatechuate 3,4-dioxygenase alpha subunit